MKPLQPERYAMFPRYDVSPVRQRETERFEETQEQDRELAVILYLVAALAVAFVCASVPVVLAVWRWFVR